MYGTADNLAGDPKFGTTTVEVTILHSSSGLTVIGTRSSGGNRPTREELEYLANYKATVAALPRCALRGPEPPPRYQRPRPRRPRPAPVAWPCAVRQFRALRA